MFLNRFLCLETILIGKRNILWRVGDKVITMSLQQEKRKQVTSERQKFICTKKEDNETQEK